MGDNDSRERWNAFPRAGIILGTRGHPPSPRQRPVKPCTSPRPGASAEVDPITQTTDRVVATIRVCGSRMTALMTIVSILLGLLGLLLLGPGWRIDNHPWRRKCRFDLKSVWPGAARCPECGIDLERIDAVELGQRERRPLASDSTRGESR